MRKFLIMSAVAAAFGLVAMAAPADASARISKSVATEKTSQIDLSARRYYRRYGHRYRHYYRPYYARPYYYPYSYYGPGYYPYRYSYPYYRRPGLYFGFGF